MPAPDYAIDAVQAPIPAALDVWHTAAQPPLTITYAFEDQTSAEFLRTFPNFTPWTGAQQEAVRWALREYESVINVRFVEVPGGSADPDFVFGRADLGNGGDARWKISYALDGSGQAVAKSWDASMVWDNSVDLTTTGARYLILHEIGHGLLMKHAGDYDVSGGTAPGPFLPAAEESRDYTVMSYTLTDNQAPATQLQLYDVAALQARWGANTHEAAGDNVYAFADNPGIFAIWDTGGLDRIDAGAETAPADIDLAEGAFSKLAGQNRMSIAWGAQIEDAVGGAGADRLRGNALDNRLTGAAGDDTLEGGAGLDYLRGEAGNDLLLGGADFDNLNGNQGDDVVRGGPGDDWVVGGKDNDQLFGDDGFDILQGNLGDDTCEGGEGADLIRGGQSNDLLIGGAGDDWLSGDRGDDTLTGGSGADTFHSFADAGIDRVLDFNPAEGDRVLLDPGTAYAVSQAGADTLIDMGPAGRMVLVGVQAATLPGGWIV